ncbi:MAG: radical SAM protein [Acidobacteriota bacterium]|nr:radical SAM protein [Acidobacteriota bacterium]
MKHPRIEMAHLDNLWFQVTGTLCNLACTHCFNSSGPDVKTFGHLSIEQVRHELEEGARRGVREVFFTGGEPFLHTAIAEMLEASLEFAATTVLTNGTLINDRMSDRLAEIEHRSRYSLEIRVSLDSFDERTNDAIRGVGVFKRVMATLARLSRRGLLPLVTVVRTWSDAEEQEILPGFTRILREAGYQHPRIKILPALPLGRELVRLPGAHDEPWVTEEMMHDFDADLLMCSNSRIVTDRGVWVCPLLVEKPDARLGDHLADAASGYELAHRACYSCYQYGTFCSNISAGIEGTGTLATHAEHGEA